MASRNALRNSIAQPPGETPRIISREVNGNGGRARDLDPKELRVARLDLFGLRFDLCRIAPDQLDGGERRPAGLWLYLRVRRMPVLLHKDLLPVRRAEKAVEQARGVRIGRAREDAARR